MSVPFLLLFDEGWNEMRVPDQLISMRLNPDHHPDDHPDGMRVPVRSLISMKLKRDHLLLGGREFLTVCTTSSSSRKLISLRLNLPAVSVEAIP